MPNRRQAYSKDAAAQDEAKRNFQFQGGFVKLAFGGAKYSMGVYIRTEDDIARFASSIQDAVAEYGFDGIDLDVEDGGASALTQVGLTFIRMLARLNLRLMGALRTRG